MNGRENTASAGTACRKSRQAPLSRPKLRRSVKPVAAEAVAEVAKGLGRVEDDELREALARLGATIKRK